MFGQKCCYGLAFLHEEFCLLLQPNSLCKDSVLSFFDKLRALFSPILVAELLDWLSCFLVLVDLRTITTCILPRSPSSQLREIDNHLRLLELASYS